MMKAGVLLVLYIVTSFALLWVAITGFNAGLQLGRSFDPAIMFTVASSRGSGDDEVTVPTEQVVSLYRYAGSLRKDLSTVYLLGAGLSFLLCAALVGMVIYQLRSNGRRITEQMSPPYD